MKQYIASIAAMLLFLWLVGPVLANGPFEYSHPLPGAELIMPETSIGIRHGDAITPETIAGTFIVTGSVSQVVTGTVVLADDNATVIFKPSQPFTNSERITVTVKAGLETTGGQVLDGTTWHFTITPGLEPTDPASDDDTENTASASPHPHYKTVPPGFPVITVTTNINRSDGYLFATYFQRGTTENNYAVIIDENGEPVYALFARAWDFKKVNENTLSYFGGDDVGFVLLDNQYQQTDVVTIKHGYQTGFHDIVFLDNGHYLAMAYDPQPVDMSQIVEGGLVTATVEGFIAQEIDTQGNVIFEWRSWDYIAITETHISLLEPEVDYFHGNALEIDTDGNLLISARDTSQIVKVNRATTEVIWRFGSPYSDFTLVNTDTIFASQHDIRRLDNGNVTVFDNRGAEDYSRVLEYQLDEVNFEATLVNVWRNTPDTFGGAMGSARVLDNGNVLVSWGRADSPKITEFSATGEKVYELTYPTAYASYRAVYDTWTGAPTWAPTLVITAELPTQTNLYVSWNGATEVDSWAVYGGVMTDSLSLLDTVPKTGFETSIAITDTTLSYFNVRALDSTQTELPFGQSNTVSLNDLGLPVIITE